MDLALGTGQHQHELKVALLAALLLHILLLVLVPGISQPKPRIENPLSLTLLTNTQTELAERSNAETVIEPVSGNKQRNKNKIEQSNRKNLVTRADSSPLNINQTSIDSWASQDVRDSLQANQSALDGFDRTFVVPQSVSEPLLQAYADSFGVRYFERTVGNNKVCFQVEGAQQQDQWDFPKLALYHTCQQPKDFEFKMR